MSTSKKLKNEKKPNPFARNIVVTFKVNAEEMRAILSRAGAFTKRDVSKWVRFSSLHFKPSKGDFEK